jgi:hypothetical protein
MLIHQSVQQQLVLPLVSNELERIWNELSMAHSRYYVGIQGYTDMTLCVWMGGGWGFKASQCLHFQGQAILQNVSNPHPKTVSYLRKYESSASLL